MLANLQRGFLCTVRAAISSYFARSQLWRASGVKPGGRGLQLRWHRQEGGHLGSSRENAEWVSGHPSYA